MRVTRCRSATEPHSEISSTPGTSLMIELIALRWGCGRWQQEIKISHEQQSNRRQQTSPPMCSLLPSSTTVRRQSQTMWRHLGSGVPRISSWGMNLLFTWSGTCCTWCPVPLRYNARQFWDINPFISHLGTPLQCTWKYVGNLWLLGDQNGRHVDTANAKRHMAHYGKTCRHPQNRNYGAYSIVARDGPSHHGLG